MSAPQPCCASCVFRIRTTQAPRSSLALPAGGPRAAGLRLRRLHRQAVEHQVALLGGAGAPRSEQPCVEYQGSFVLIHGNAVLPLGLAVVKLHAAVRGVPHASCQPIHPIASPPPPSPRWTPRPTCARCAGAPAPATSWRWAPQTTPPTCTTCGTPPCRCAPSRGTGGLWMGGGQIGWNGCRVGVLGSDRCG